MPSIQAKQLTRDRQIQNDPEEKKERKIEKKGKKERKKQDIQGKRESIRLGEI